MIGILAAARSRVAPASRVRLALLCGAAAFAFSGQALAQSSGGAQAAASDQTTIGEVIVTAQRRAERLRDVPISITTATGEQLAKAGVKNLADLTTIAPGVKIDNAGTYVQPAVRGISSVVIGPGTDAPVALYLDGVIQPNQLANHFDFADIDRVEVVKGPQGTLFGRNATGGAVSIFTISPSFTPKGSLTLGYGNYKDVLAKGYVAGPLVADLLAGSLSAYYETHDGYTKDVARQTRTPGLDSKNVRGKLLFTPTDWTRFTVTAGFQDRFDSGATEAIPLNGNTQARFYPSSIITTVPHTQAFNDPSFLHVKQTSVNFQAEFDTPYGTVKNLFGWAHSDVEVHFDEDRAFNPNPTRAAYLYNSPDTTYSNELTFTSKKLGKASFVTGLYYYRDDNQFNHQNIVFGDPVIYFLDYINKNPQLAYAAFGEFNYELTDRLTFVGGLRYSWESRKSKGQIISQTGFPIPGGGSLPTPEFSAGHVTFDAITPRASLRYAVTPQTNVYFTYSQGFKSGGVQAGGFLTPANLYLAGLPTNVDLSSQIYQPEKIKAYEIGIKTADIPRVDLNAAFYYYDYSNLQVQVNLTSAIGFIQNAASAKIYGLDFDATVRVTDDFRVKGGLSLLHARYSDYPNATALFPLIIGGQAYGNCPTIASAVQSAACKGFNFPNGVDLSGNQLPRAPDWSLTLTPEYHHDFGPGVLDVSATLYHSDQVFFDSAERVSQKPYTTLAAQVSWSPAGTRFRFTAWGANLTDEDYLISVYEDATTDGAGYAPPRTFGATINYAF
jgi:iron complex outermembrane receptor protein